MNGIVDISELLLLAGLSASATDTERALAADMLASAEAAVRDHLHYDPTQAVRTEFYPTFESALSSSAGVWEVNSSSAFYRRGNEIASNELQLRHLPVRQADVDGSNTIDVRIDYSAKAGTVSGSFSSETQKTVGSDFWPNYDGVDSSGYAICRDGILRSQGRWPLEPGSVRVTYLSGYTAEELRGVDSSVDARPILEAVKVEAIRRINKAYSRMKKTRVGFGSGPINSERMGDYSYTTDTQISSMLTGTSSDVLPETAQMLSKFVNYGWSLSG